MDTLALAGAWISIFLTVCILSFLFEDNPVYKFAEHLFMGVATSVSVLEQYYGTFRPNLIDKVAEGNRLSLVPAVLCVLLLFKLTRKWSWVARIPIAFIVAVFAGLKLTGEANASLMTQVAKSMPNLTELYQQHGLWDHAADGQGVISGLVVVLGLAACLLHFYFSAAHNRPLRIVSRVGVLILMLSFGAAFGLTVMGRISLAIGRAEELLGLNRPLDQVEQIHPKVVTLISMIVVIGLLAIWKSRNKNAEAG